MVDSLIVILKVLLISSVLTLLIKYIGPSLAIPASTTSSLIAVLTPALVMGGVLLWQGALRPHG